VAHWPKKKGATKSFLETVFTNSAFDAKGFVVKHLINESHRAGPPYIVKTRNVNSY